MTSAEQRFHELTTAPAGTTALQLVQRYATHDATIFAEHVLEDEKRFGTITLAALHRCLLDHTRYAFERGVRAINLMPPGSGKTYSAARMISTLLHAGRRVGITGTSHKVISNLLTAVLKAADDSWGK